MRPATAAFNRTDAGERAGILTVEKVILLIWLRRWVFVAVALLCAAAIITWAFVVTPRYRVTVTLIPQHDESSGGSVQSLLGQFAGPAALMGIDMGSSLNAEEAIALLKSRSLFEILAQRENLMPLLFPTAWDAVSKRWRPNLKILPTMSDAWQLFDHIRTVDQDQKTGVVTLQITWKDRWEAAAWANELVGLANEELRKRALDEAQASVDSLQNQLQGIKSMDLRDAIYRVMEVQINREVMAKARPDYAFAVLDRAVVPDANKFSSPRRGLLVFVAFPFGIVMACLVIVGLQFAGDISLKLRRLIAHSD